MQFKSNEKLNLLACTDCNRPDNKDSKVCKICKTKSLGLFYDNKFYFFPVIFSDFHVKLKKATRILNKFRFIFSFLFSILFFTLFFLEIYRNNLFLELFSAEFWFSEDYVFQGFFWLAIFFVMYFWYRLIMREKKTYFINYERGIEKKEGIYSKTLEKDLTWNDLPNYSKKNQINISKFLTPDAWNALQNAYELARKFNSREVNIDHLFISLLDFPAIQNIFIRLGIPAKILQARFVQRLKKEKYKSQILFNEDLNQILFHGFFISKELKDNRYRLTAILLSTVQQSEFLQEVLYDLKIDSEKLKNVIEWVRINEKLWENYHEFRKAASGINKYGMDRAMTAVATPYLNNFSRDITIAAKYGNLDACVAREKEIEEVFRILEGGKNNVVLVGDRGVGKLALIQGIVQKMINGDAPKKLLDKRFVQISTSSLMAGTTIAGAQERMIRIMNEVARAGNIILFIKNLQDLLTVSEGQKEGLDVSETLAEYLSSGRFIMFATTTKEAYNQFLTNTEIGSVFSKVDVEEMNINQAIQVLESRVSVVEYKNSVFFSYEAVESCVNFADKFFYDQNLPESAISLMMEVASYVKSKRGKNQLVTKEDVAIVINEKTGIPATTVSEDEGQKLLRLEEEMHKRVVGQDLAVSMIANALRRARAEIRSVKKPIANFLFLGPTGVGKTELAKTIAEVYFGGEKQMIRIDMSEFQDKSSIYRLIGEPNVQGTGILTEAVRQNPFSLVLLDELEKADQNVLNLFLQVFDDGRLTDSVGRTIDFTNTIIIATSNAGSSFVQDQVSKGIDLESVRDILLKSELKNYYKPEFLNRFDGVILFKALNKEEIKIIASLMLKRVAKDLEKRGIELKVENSALNYLAEIGFDPEFGARPMRRAIQDKVENKLAEIILKGALKRRDIIVLGENCEIEIKSANK
ncbi:MAG: ATP-dependent Clp protease ATP-binding subunit [Patescibacteria group bacterium]